MPTRSLPPLLPRPRRIESCGGAWDPATAPALRARVEPGCGLPPEGFRLVLSPTGAEAVAPNDAGLAHARSALDQLVRGAGGLELPCSIIEDAPAFPVRGYMLDISRDKVPSMPALFDIVDTLAELRFNRLELYTEHTFAYRAHPEVWAGADPMTPDELRALDVRCRERHIDLVPNQNSLGHMERWLRHPLYAPLAECPEGFRSPWGPEWRPPSTLDPTNPASLELVLGLYDELLPNFGSRSFNIGCDEPFELGRGRSRAACEQLGRGRVYLEFLQKLHARVQAHGRVTHFWGDVAHEHPDLIPELPRDSVALEWGYEAGHPFVARGGRFAGAGLPFLLCPGTSTWNALAGRWSNAAANLREATGAAMTLGARGLMVTDWGDGGHWQPHGASLLPLAAAAECFWTGAGFDEAGLLRAADLHVFRDPSGILATAARDLADTHRLTGIDVPNASALFSLLQPDPPPRVMDLLDSSRLAATDEAIAAAAARVSRAGSVRPDAAALTGGLMLAAELMRLACRRGIALAGGRGGDEAFRTGFAVSLEDAIRAFRRHWLERNRPGGLADSAGRLERLLAFHRDGAVHDTTPPA